MDLNLIIQLVSGAVGGNIAGNLMKNASLGTALNSVVGIIGGGLGGQLLGMMGIGAAAAAGTMDIGTIIGQVAAGGVGGAVLLAIVGFVRNAMAKQ